MAGSSATYKLIAQVEGEQRVRLLAEQLAQAKREFDDAARSGTASSAAMDAYARSVANLTVQLRQAQGGTANLGRAGLEASRALEDLQYGVNGVVNNIPSLVQGLGGTAGIAAVASLAAIAVNQLVKHWDDLMGAFGASATKTAAEEMKELEENTKRTANETDRLNQLKRDDKTQKTLSSKVEEMKTALPEANKKAADGIGKAITERGGFDKLMSVMKKDTTHLDQFISPEDREKVNKGYGIAEYITPQKALDEARQAKLKDARKNAEGRMEEHFARPETFGNQKEIETFRQRVLNNKDALKKEGFDVDGFLMDLDKSNPQAIKEAEAAKKQQEIKDKLKDAGKKLMAGLDKAAKEKVEKQKRIDEAMGKAADADQQAFQDKEDAYQKAKKEGYDRAKGFGMRLVEEKAAGGTIDRDRIKQELIDSGMGKEDAEKKARMTLRGFNDFYRDTINARAAKDGGGVEQAKVDIAFDASEKKRKEQEAKRDKHVKEGSDALDVKSPYIEKDVRNSLLRREAGGQSSDAAIKAVVREMAAGLKAVLPNFTEEERNKLAQDRVDDAQKGINRDLAKDDNDKAKGFEFEKFGVADLADKIQAAAFGDKKDTAEKTLEVEKQILEAIRAQNGRARIGRGRR